MDAIKDKAIEAKDLTGSYAVSAKDTVTGTAQTAADKTSEAALAAKKTALDTAQAAKDKAAQVTGSDKETAQAGKDQPGFLERTGEQVIGLAQGAADAVKNTIGGPKK